MICPECNGRGESIYYAEIYRDENSVTVEQRKGICQTCNGSGEKPQTNADRIRAMSDEEMAEHEVRITQDGMYYECSDGETFAIYEDAIAHEIKRLKQPAEEGPHE